LALGSISGFVPEDVDNNDSGDYPLDLVNMTLLDSSEVVIAFVLTTNNGFYVFNDLPSGSYTVIKSDLPDYVSVSDVSGANDKCCC
jgi:hypothetical protein